MTIGQPSWCDIHWNANLEVAAIEHYEETEIVPMAIVRARRDFEKDSEILTRYRHQEKDAGQNIFECECCECTNRTGTTNNPMAETADTTAIEEPVFIEDYAPQKEAGHREPGPRPQPDTLSQQQAGLPRLRNGWLGLGCDGSFPLQGNRHHNQTADSTASNNCESRGRRRS